MPVQFEQCGPILDFLEARLFIHDGKPSLGCKWPCFSSHQGSSHPPSDCQISDVHSPNTPSMMQSLVPNVFKKCQWYQFSPLQSVVNIVNAVTLFQIKGFPKRWWAPTLKAQADRVDVGPLFA